MKWLHRWADQSLREENRRLWYGFESRGGLIRAQAVKIGSLRASLHVLQAERDALRERLGDAP